LENSLVVSHNDTIIFTSNQHWLHPLFELEDFLKQNQYDTSKLYLRDKIAGKAAACLIVYLGIKRCHIELISDRAIPIFERHGIAYTYDHKVEQIQCRTETLITADMGISDAYLFLRKRAGRVMGLPVRMKNVSIQIEEKLLVDKVDLFVDRGEQIVIHGPNGAGKTTLLRAILGFIPVTNGTIEVGEYEVGSQAWKKNRSKVAWIHQESIKNDFPITAGEVVKIGLGNLGLPRSESDYRAEVAMRSTGSYHLYQQPYNTLSGGEKQRVSIARCLCQRAGVFLLDEPTSFLDQHGKEDLLELLYEVSNNEAPTMIIVSHEHQWIERLNWISLELKGGKLC
jgi:ABC-type cobalamin/Fe3+-siderophores transport system ATPase subunit